MANSDDEIEDLPEWVTNYYFEDDNEGPISFSVLPFCWNTAETTTDAQKKIYVRGNAHDGLEKIFKPVKAWRFDISGAKPEISVLCKDNNWIELQKPRTSFEEYVRTILVTINFLHLAKKNPEMPGKRIWKKLSNIFSLYDVIPSVRDLLHHKELIEQVMKHDESLKESKHLVTLLQRYPPKMQKVDEDVLNKGKSDFVVDDDNCSLDDLEDDSSDDDDGSGGEHAGSADEEDGEEESFDSVCSICDEGGPLLCCEGSCMRSFHATLRAGQPSQCSSLGFTEKEVQAMPYFKCENCQLKQHQCFGCGRLDSSDKQAGAKVFQCVNATCGYFYHPLCVAKRLCVKDATTAAAEELANKILSGESFTCPLHICFKCKQGEDKSNVEMQMAVCRRCPKAYHKKCLPKDIAFEEDEDANINQRAWDGLLVDRILIYCLKHEILDDLGTPARDHIIFPSKFKKDNAASTVAPKKLTPSLRAPTQAVPTSESRKKAINDSDPDKKIAIKVPKLQRSNTSKKLASEKKSGLVKTDERKYSRQLSVVSTNNIEKPEEVVSIQTSKIGVKTPEPQLDSDSERRILDLINEASSIITLDDIIAKHEKLISSRSYQQKTDSCKSITMGKVEASCEAVRAASKKLAAGYEEDANNICGRKVVIQMANWKGKLRVYLAPFLHGMRYTSFGRHFTKVEKLKEVSDTLHWYANEGDTIVDFCCGANDFSCLMKQNLEKRGIKCNYKNYDLFPPKNDFCFETRDWLTVKPSELPNGSKLIMGINPPFGVKSYLANKFINKALQFKPKLIVLIVPPETERLDKKKPAYDLIWEYDDKLSGKSFYLPGSVDINDNQMEDWNLVTPVLYLWSRPDWTSKHMEIAEKHQHLPGERRENKLTMKLGRDSSFKIENQSITNVDNNPPNAHLSVIDKAVSEGNDVDKRSARADRSMDKNLHVVSGDSRPKKGPKKKRQRVVRNIRREPESSHKYKRQRSSLDRPRDEVVLRSPSDMEIDQFQPTRYDERRSSESHTPRYQGSAQNELRAVGHVSHGHFDSGHYGDRERERERERLSLLDNRPFRLQESPSNVDIRDHLNNHPRASYSTGNYGNAYHDTYQNIRDTSYPPPQRHPDSTIGYMNQSFGGSVESYPTSAFNRAATNSVSAIDKYNFSLDAPNHGRMAGGGFSRPDIGPPVGASLYHHQAPPRQGYPYDQRDFSQGPTRSHSYHIPPGGWIDD